MASYRHDKEQLSASPCCQSADANDLIEPLRVLARAPGALERIGAHCGRNWAQLSAVPPRRSERA